VNPNWTRVAAALAAEGIPVDENALAAAEPYAKRKLDEAITVQTTDDPQRGWLYFNLILDAAGIQRTSGTDAALETLRLYHSQSNLWEGVLPGVPEALADIRERVDRMIVISNANGKLHVLLDRVGLSGFFDVIVDSFVEGVEKPDPRLFEIALGRAGARADEALHVGDIYHVDVAGARAAGMVPLLLDPCDLYTDADCERVRALSELVHHL
jgi:HAD superfamily hydrolase (TIGR01549 family)